MVSGIVRMRVGWGERALQGVGVVRVRAAVVYGCGRR